MKRITPTEKRRRGNGEVFAKFYRAEVHYTVDGQAVFINVTHPAHRRRGRQAQRAHARRARGLRKETNPALDVTWTAAAANGLTITGYEAQYRKKVADGEEANAWTAYTGTLDAAATTLNLPNLEAGATYEVQVRAVTSQEAGGPWSDSGSARANRPPRTDIQSPTILHDSVGRGRLRQDTQ